MWCGRAAHRRRRCDGPLHRHRRARLHRRPDDRPPRGARTRRGGAGARRAARGGAGPRDLLRGRHRRFPHSPLRHGRGSRHPSRRGSSPHPAAVLPLSLLDPRLRGRGIGRRNVPGRARQRRAGRALQRHQAGGRGAVPGAARDDFARRAPRQRGRRTDDGRRPAARRLPGRHRARGGRGRRDPAAYRPRLGEGLRDGRGRRAGARAHRARGRAPALQRRLGHGHDPRARSAAASPGSPAAAWKSRPTRRSSPTPPSAPRASPPCSTGTRRGGPPTCSTACPTWSPPRAAPAWSLPHEEVPHRHHRRAERARDRLRRARHGAASDGLTRGVLGRQRRVAALRLGHQVRVRLLLARAARSFSFPTTCSGCRR